jgi:hypothetical protein
VVALCRRIGGRRADSIGRFLDTVLRLFNTGELPAPEVLNHLRVNRALLAEVEG